VSRARLIVVGDVLLDRDIEGSVERLAPEGVVPVLDEHRVGVRPGGAGFAAALAVRDGHDVTLVTALAPDPPGAELRSALERCGIDVIDLGLDGATPEKIRLRTQDRTLLRLDRGGRAGSVGAATGDARAAVASATGILVSDYGRGVAADPQLREAIRRAAAHGAPTVWDPHPRGAPPVAGAALCTPNADEAKCFAAGEATLENRARALLEAWCAHAVCVTRGARGALLARAGRPLFAVPAMAVSVGDACGAGDRFAVRAAGVLAGGGGTVGAVASAVASATAFVRDGGALAVGLDDPRMPGPGPVAVLDAEALAASIRADGRTLVAAGGCFDLLHPGHVRALQAARALGDCLIVCLNSDASVRRLKGPGRPVAAEHDRAAVLEALGCVDAVAIFDEDTPSQILERLRPHVWVKGEDYDGRRLPEEETLARWGGRAVLLPFFAGRSTTGLIERAASHVA
jgi:rfaE bifunctional protein nucleotidyltransferase chain/domain/rfaE bifunctional protein kinase chain/domain